MGLMSSQMSHVGGGIKAEAERHLKVLLYLNMEQDSGNHRLKETAPELEKGREGFPPRTLSPTLIVIEQNPLPTSEPRT